MLPMPRAIPDLPSAPGFATLDRMNASPSQRQLLRRQCTLTLPGFRSLTPVEEFEALARWCAQRGGAEANVYGEGGLAVEFEQRIATLLGKPAAVFMPSGVMAQLIALRLHAEQARLDRFGMSPNAHLALHEREAPQALFGLHGVSVGSRLQPLRAEDLAAVKEPLAALVVELPMREAGGLLPEWDELQALQARAAEMRLPLHLDGARLWQCRAFYGGRSFAEIAAGFESVYVSVYKDIGGMSGALLAGSENFVAQARIWLRRMGGNLYQQTAMVASAMMRFDERLATMDACHRRAVQVAEVLAALPGVRVNPRRPQANMFHLHVEAPAEALNAARDAIAEEERAWLFGAARPMDVQGFSAIELTVGDNLLALDDATMARLFERLLARARA